MRVVVDCRCVFAGCGGIGNYALQLVRALALVDRANEYILLQSTARPSVPIVDRPNFRQVACPAAMLDAEWEQLQLPTLLDELEADLYHNPTFALPLVRPCPTVTTIHDVVFHYRPDLVRPALCGYLRQWAEAAAHSATLIITVSEYSKAAIVAAYGVPPERVVVTYEAADCERFGPTYGGAREDELRSRYGIRGPYVLYVGSLEPKKNLDRLLDAFADAQRAMGLTHTLVLAGGQGGMDWDVRSALRERDLERSVVVTGFLPDDLLPYAYGAAELFVYPSLYEGFGLPPLEAMACGTPVLVSDATSLPEVVGDAALVVGAEDVVGLSQAIQDVLTDPDLRTRLAALGVRRAARFSWQQTALRTLRCYCEAARARRSPATPQHSLAGAT